MSSFLARSATSGVQQKRGALSRLMVTSALVAVGAVAIASPAHAADYTLPVNGTVVGGGSATITPSGIDKLDVNQVSNRVVINWDSFNIGTDATVQFYQPNSGSLAVNRVVSVGSDPTRILGTLKANGQVMVLDRNGVLFGSGSIVDLGGIVASTGDVDTAAVMGGAGILTLSNFGTGEILNQGLISAADTGLVAFVGPVVKNNGIINAKLGRVALAAGNETATVDLYGDGLVELAYTDKNDALLSENTGEINAAGGRINMTVAAAKDIVDSVVNMNGVAHANSATITGGKIVLSAKKVKVGHSASVKADTTKVTAKSVDLDATIDGAVTGSASEVNVLSNNAKIMQGLEILDANGTINVAAGTYDEDLVISKNGVILKGAQAGVDTGDGVRGAETLITPHSPGVVVNADNVTVDGLSIDGASNGIEVLAGADNADIKNNIITNSTNHGIVVTDSLGSTLTGNLIQKTGNHGIYVVGSANTTLDANQIGVLTSKDYNINGDGILLENSNGSVVFNNRIANTKSTAALIGSGVHVKNSDNVNVVENTIFDADWDGVKVTGGDNIDVTGNDIDHVVRVGVFAQNGTNVDATENDIFDAKYYGVQFMGVVGSSIAGNTVDTTGRDGISVLYAGSGVNTVSGNVVNNTGAHGVYTAYSKTTISGNEIGLLGGDHNIKGDGVLLENSNGTIVTENTITDTTSTAALIGSGVHVKNSSHVTVSENTIYDTAWDGVKVTAGDDVHVNGNDIDRVARVGVFAQNSTNTEASENNIFDAKLYGVQFMGVIGSDISENVINTTGRDGISVLYAGSGVNTVSGNIINSTGANGIYTSYSKTTISGNEIGLLDGNFNIKGDGVLLENSDGTVVSGNTITDTKSTAAEIGSGVHVKNSNHVSVSKNTIFDTDWDGVKVTNGDDVTVSGNDIDRVARVGVYAKGTKNVTASGNDIDNAGLFGVRFMSVEGSSIADNTIDTIGQDGISLLYSEKGTNTITGNKVNGTGKNGVYTLYSKSTISGNEIGLLGGDFNIHGDGVLLENSNGTVVSGNTITGTLSTADEVGSGVHSKNSDDVTVSGNTIYGTDWDGVKVTGGNNVDVTENDIDNVERAGVFAKFASDVSIAGNDIFGAGMVGAMVQDMFGSSSITDNHIDQVELDGVNVLRSDDVVVSGNFIGYGDDGLLGEDDTYSDRDGVRLEDASNVSVLNNKITNSHEDGVHAINVGGLIRIEGNTIDNSSANGVLVDGYAPGTEIVMLMAKTLSEGDSGNGLYVLHNDINESGNNGIELVNVAGKVRVRHNDVSNSGSNGIYVHGTYGGDYMGFYDGYSDAGLDLLISRNDIEDSYFNGIYLSNIDGDIRVKHNDIYNSSYIDGIRVENVNSNNTAVTEDVYAEDYSGYYGYDGQLVISGNDINQSGNNGIGLYNVGGMVRVKHNHITNSGSNGIYAGDESSYGEARIALFDYPYGGSNQIDLLIEANHISNSGSNGVYLSGIDGDIRILRNCILNSYEGDGIRAQYVNNDYYDVPSVALASIEGVEVPSDEEVYPTNPGHQLIIDSNDIDRSGYDGISLYNVSDLVRISDNSITNSGHDGIYAFNSDVPFYDGYYGEGARFEKYSSSPIDLYILNNTIENYGYDGEVTKMARIIDGPSEEGYYGYNGNAAIELNIGSEGSARIAGNTMGSYFDYGLLGYSGNIDLTGKKNTIHDVNIGMGFYPNDVVKYLSEEVVPSSDAYFQYLANRLHLVGDTIGKTAFVDNAELFIDLGYGAFFAPGFPTILDGMNATYETAGSIIDPSATGILSISEYAYLESMINHYIDSQDRGLFFFNVQTPEGVSIDQKDVFRNFVFGGGQGTGGSLVITGLPNVGGRNGGFTPPVNFNDIAPAAGEEEDSNGQQNIAGVEPAAGGDANNTSCWADATQSLGAGTPVTFNFGAGASQLLQDAVNCGNGSNNNGQAL